MLSSLRVRKGNVVTVTNVNGKVFIAKVVKVLKVNGIPTFISLASLASNSSVLRLTGTGTYPLAATYGNIPVTVRLKPLTGTGILTSLLSSSGSFIRFYTLVKGRASKKPYLILKYGNSFIGRG